MTSVQLIECPRDAWQGIKEFIPTEKKIKYLQSLLQVGFDVLDFGSFVSPKAIPQMQDTVQVLEGLDLSSTTTQLLAIVANERGADQALQYSQIDFLGYPFSISEIFQMRNTGKTIMQSVEFLQNIIEKSHQKNKEVVTYLSMGFGNPYGDPWHPELVAEWVEKLKSWGVKIVSLSDTVGTADAKTIAYLFSTLIPMFPELEIGAHLHTHPDSWFEKMDSAYQNGCRRFDGAIMGFGGCPMAKDELTGNMPTEKILSYLTANHIHTDVNFLKFESAYNEFYNILMK